MLWYIRPSIFIVGDDVVWTEEGMLVVSRLVSRWCVALDGFAPIGIKKKEKSKEKGSFVSYPRKLSFSFSWHVARQVPKLTLLRRWSFTIGGSPHRVRCVKVWKSLLLTLSLCFILAGSVCLYYAFYFLPHPFSLCHNKTLIESMPLRRFRYLLIPAKFMCVTAKEKESRPRTTLRY